jgi:hypothetical protein
VSRPAVACSQIHLDEATHTYTVDGVEVPGVTRILDEVLQEYRGVDPDVLRRAQERGTAAHKAAELYDLGTLDFTSLHPEVEPRLEAYIKFLADTGFEPDTIEKPVYSARYGYCGTPDRTGKAKGHKRRWLIDLKTPAVLQRSVGPQTAAYECAARESGVIGAKEVIERYALQLRDDGTYKLIALRDPGDMNVFLAALTIYRFKNRR